MPDIDPNAAPAPANGGEGNDAAAVAAKTAADAAAAAAGSDATKAAADKVAAEKGGAPQYADFTMADGVTIDAPLLADVKALAGSLKLDQAGAQSVVDLGAKLVKTFGERQSAELKAEVARWGEATKTDPEIGGAKFNESLALANKVLGTFGSDELKSMLKESGLSQHPELVRLLTKVGAVISEDKFIPAPKPNGSRDPNDYSFMYPNSQHN